MNPSGTFDVKYVREEEMSVNLVTTVVKQIPQFFSDITHLVSTFSAPVSWSA